MIDERSIFIAPRPTGPKGSWWADDPEHFYERAAREAKRMRVMQTSTAAFNEPIGSRTKKPTSVMPVFDDVESEAA